MPKRIVAVGTLLLCLSILSAAMERQPNADYRARRQALAKKTNGGAVLLFATAEEGDNVYGYRPDNNFYYLSGWSEPAAALLIVSAAEAKDKTPARDYTEILFLPARNLTQEKWTGPKLGADDPQAAQLTGFDHVEVLDKLRDELAHLLPMRGAVYTDVPGPDETSNSQNSIEWLKRSNAFLSFPRFQDVRPLMASLRTVKDAGEIELLRKAANASVAAQLAAMHTTKPGVTEREISALLEYEWGKRGCERPAYAPIVGSGLNSTVLHYSDNTGTMQKGDVVVIDAAGEYSLYAADITRTLPVSGKFTERQKEIYNIVLGAQNAAIAAFVSGKSTFKRDDPNSISKAAYDYINTHGKDLHGEPLGKYFIHGLGHFLGLNVHDEGDYTIPLGPGMVFTIEPGIYIPEEKIGVRIEDDFYVDPGGKLIMLTEALPRNPDDVEREMAKH
jgi:Xaa-Pro aminopeptidase